MNNWGNLEGLIPVLGGVYGILLAKGVVPRKPKDPEKMLLWRRKFGPMMMILGPLTIVFGVLEMAGVLR